MNISFLVNRSPTLTANVALNYHYFFVRNVMFVKSSWPMWSFRVGSGPWMSFRGLTLIQTGFKGFPVILMGSDTAGLLTG